jgi:DnaJ family protein C protein 28
MSNLSIEEIIRRAIEEGKFDDLPGKGKPLQLDENPHEDPEWRVSHHILKSGGFTLPWIERLRQIEIDLGAARAKIAQDWTSYQENLAKNSETHSIESEWSQSVETLHEQIAGINDQIRSYNLEVPSERFQLPLINPEDEIEKTIKSP